MDNATQEVRGVLESLERVLSRMKKSGKDEYNEAIEDVQQSVGIYLEFYCGEEL